MQEFDFNRTPYQALNEERSFLKYFLLSVITLGIYSLFYFASIGRDVNDIASRYDGKKTMNVFFLAVPLIIVLALTTVLIIITPEDPIIMDSMEAAKLMVIGLSLIALGLALIVLSICLFVWTYRLTKRIGNELLRRNLDYKFGVKDFWLLDILACFFFLIASELTEGLLSWLLWSLSFVGPFIYTYKLTVSMNELAKDYNVNS